MFLLKCGDVNLPAPIKMTVNDEIIWSSDTGRTLDGTMMGDVIAEKKNINIEWAWLTEEEAALIKNTLIAGFFPLKFKDLGVEVAIEAYRGTMSKDLYGSIGDGHIYYRSVSTDIIQR
jgi:hypothetical protein